MAYPQRPPRPPGPGSYAAGLFKAGMASYSNQKFGFFSTPSVLPPPPPIVPPRFTRPVINFNVRKEFAPPPSAPVTLASHPPPMMASNKAPHPRKLAPMASKPSVPITTVFVGNITERCSDELLQKLLMTCGSINNWKRMQDSNGKYSHFGFCDFDHPEGTMRALRILNDYQLGDKKLTVKAEEQTKKKLEEFMQNQELPPAGPDGEEAPQSPVSDEDIREQILESIREENAELLELAAQAPVEEKQPSGTRSRSTSTSSSSPSSTSEHSRGTLGQKVSEDKTATQKRHGEKDAKRAKRRRSSSSRTSSSSRSSTHRSRKKRSSRRGDSGRREGDRGSRRRHRANSNDSVDSEEMAERRRLRKEIKEKEESYRHRLEKWEQREKRFARQFDKDEEADLQRRKMIQREAKKLKQFLEDYEDERDDPKYYKSSALFQRKRNYEKEREADAKDRQEEQAEIEELKRQILAENKSGSTIVAEEVEREAMLRHEVAEKKKLKHLRSHSGSPTPHRPLGHFGTSTSKPSGDVQQPDNTAEQNSNGVKVEPSAGNGKGKDRRKEHQSSKTKIKVEEAELPSAAVEEKSASPAKPVTATIQSKSTAAAAPTAAVSRPANGNVFGEEDEDEGVAHQSRRKMKPFEITREDRMQALTPEERKKMVKELIDKIPTSREELFIFAICWDYVDTELMEQRIRPWVNKKISEYIGDEEPALVAFICEKVTSHTDPKKTLSDLAMVLDEEAEAFMVKLWRLVIYESEAKRLGLNPLGSTASSTAVEGARATLPPNSRK